MRRLAVVCLALLAGCGGGSGAGGVSGPGGGTLRYDTRIHRFKIDVDPESGAISNFQVLQTLVFRQGGSMLEGFAPEVGGPLGLAFDPEGVVVNPRTGHLLVVHEAIQAAGFGAEIAATAAEALGCRVRRLGAPRIPVGYAPILEAAARIDPPAIAAAARFAAPPFRLPVPSATCRISSTSVGRSTSSRDNC